jgi:hypothetical protein
MAWTGLMISLSIITDHDFTHLHAQSAQFFFKVATYIRVRSGNSFGFLAFVLYLACLLGGLLVSAWRIYWGGRLEHSIMPYAEHRNLASQTCPPLTVYA